MAITLRNTKGSELTFQELDGNFTDLDTRVSTLENATDNDSQTLTLVGTDLSISNGNTVDLSGLGGGASGIALTDISVGAEDPAAGDGGISYDNTTGVFTYAPPDLSLYQPVGNLNADIDSHLNTSTATANQILSWDGADYAWVADQSSGSGIALTDLSVTTAAASGTPSLAYDNTTGVFTYTPLDLSNAIVSQSQYTTTVTTNAVDTSDTSAYIVGNTGSASATGTSTGWVFADVVQDPDNPGTTTILDVDAAIFTGSVVGDITTGTGTQTIQGTVDFTSATSVDFTGVTVNGLPSSTYGDADVATYLNGNLDSHIIPDTNATYDIGSAEYKIRHFYLSNNSMKFVDDADPANPVEYALGVTNDYRLQFNGSALKNSSSTDAVAGPIDITKTNHFVQNGQTYTLLDAGTYVGQELKFWKIGAGLPGHVDITLSDAFVTDGTGTTNLENGFNWRLGDANTGMYSCIWNGTAWVLSGGQAAV